jgi:hypothetical protein
VRAERKKSAEGFPEGTFGKSAAAYQLPQCLLVADRRIAKKRMNDFWHDSPLFEAQITTLSTEKRSKP